MLIFFCGAEWLFLFFCLFFIFIYLQALSNQQKAVLMSERVLGIEHPNTIQEYVSYQMEEELMFVMLTMFNILLNLFVPFICQMHLALYCFANNQLSTALKLLYRARYLMLLICGEDHPEMALLDVSADFACWL